MGTAPRLTRLEHGGKPGHSHLGTQSTASCNATAAQARSTPPLTPAGPGSSYLFQLAVDVLNDQVDSHCVSAPWSEPKSRDSLVRTTVLAVPETHFFLKLPTMLKKYTVPQTSLP